MSENTREALRIVDQLIPLTKEALKDFKSARNWGIADILGGGFIIDLIKHSKLNKASSVMNEINFHLGQLQKVLKDISFPSSYRMDKGTFATFADFFFDGTLADIYMESKIISSINTVNDLLKRLIFIRERLLEMEKLNYSERSK